MATSFPPKGDADKKIGAFSAPLSVSAQDTPNMTVRVRAGAFFNGENSFVEYAGGSSPTITAPVGNPKWVVVAMQNSGLLTVINGTPSSAPTLPAVPAGNMPLAAVFVTPTTTAITQSLIADVRPFLRTVDVVPDLTAELSNRPTVSDLNSALALKADVDGTPATTFALNSDFTTGTPTANAEIVVTRGASPSVSIRWNETSEQWELTNDGSTFSPIAAVAGTFAPLVHTHVAADVTDFTSAVNALVASATITQSQVTNLTSDLAAKATTAALNAHVANAGIHFTLPITQTDVTGLTTALAGKMATTGGTFSGDVTVAPAGSIGVTISSDATTGGLLVPRAGADAALNWNETAGTWQVGVIGTMSDVLTSAVVAGKVDTTTQVLAGAGLTGGGTLAGDVTIGLPNVGTPVTDAAVKVTTDAKGRVSATSALTAADVGAAPVVHTHVAADITDLSTAVDSAVNAQVGVSVQGYDQDLTALAALSSTGMLARTGASSFATRAVTGTASRVVVTNGNGVAGAPTIDVAEAGIDHDALLNFAPNEHVDHGAVQVLSGIGLSGGGDLTATRTLSVAAVKGSRTFSFPAIAVGASATSSDTLTITGAAIGDPVLVGLSPTPPVGFIYQAFVSGLNTVSVRATNVGGGTGAGDATEGLGVIVLQYGQF